MAKSKSIMRAYLIIWCNLLGIVYNNLYIYNIIIYSNIQYSITEDIFHYFNLKQSSPLHILLQQ